MSKLPQLGLFITGNVLAYLGFFILGAVAGWCAYHYGIMTVLELRVP
jgi:hypothetical protein